MPIFCKKIKGRMQRNGNPLFVFFHRSLSPSCFLPPLSLYPWIISSLHFWHRVVSITGGGSQWAQLADLWPSASCPLKHSDLRVTETKMGCESADWQMTESYASSSNASVYSYSSQELTVRFKPNYNGWFDYNDSTESSLWFNEMYFLHIFS